MKLSAKLPAVIAVVFAVGLLGYWSPSFGQMGCSVQCTCLTCYQDCNGNFLLYDNNGCCNAWNNAKAGSGCLPSGCSCSKAQSANLFLHKSSNGTAQCNALCNSGTLQNGGQVNGCNMPTGSKLGPFTCCLGCNPLSSP